MNETSKTNTEITSRVNDMKNYLMLGPQSHSFFSFYKNVVFLAQAEYSYFSADFRLKIVLYNYS